MSSIQSLLKIAEEDADVVAVGEGIDKYLFERYANDTSGWKRRAYYAVKPLIPRPIQIMLRRKYTGVQSASAFPSWPIEPILTTVVDEHLKETLRVTGKEELHRIAPWPAGKRFAFVITHDVEWDRGLRRAAALVDVEKRLGCVSSWNLVPERYPIDWGIVKSLRSEGFEIGIHGLKHDGKLFQSKKTFDKRVRKINQYAREWGAVGFRSPSTLRNAAWMPDLDFSYDSSFPDTDPYEPQPGGCCSIWPYFIDHLLELPLTMPQDHTLFEILGHKDLAAWKRKASWIEEHSGLVLINVHPDYIDSDERLSLYEDFLKEMKEKRELWHALPRDIAAWWREREASRLVCEGGKWVVRGSIAARAAVIRTSLKGDQLVHDVCS